MTSDRAGTPYFRVAIIGTGFAGLGTAIRLKQAGLRSLVLLERANEIGGTWRDNSYPGAACDVPSHLYSFSFARNPEWSRSFSPQQEIWDYLLRVAKEHDVLRHVRFNHEVQAARWDPGGNRWWIETTGGTVTAQFLVSAAGPLADPAIPDIPGLARFRGRVFHSATWDHGYDLRGREVAVVGTGASAIQFVPEVQPLVRRLRVFQRTAPWIIPRHDRDITDIERWLFRNVPISQEIARQSIYWGRELYVLGFVHNPRIMKLFERVALRHLHRQVRDPDLQVRLTPTFTMGCKRILLSNDYYPTLTRPNVELVTGGVSEVREHEVVSADGVVHPADTIIFGTGFHVTDAPIAQRLYDAEGRSLAEEWGGGMQALRGTTVAGYPNLFVLTGPNTGLGHSSQVFMIEAQIAYVMAALRYAYRHGLGYLEPLPAAQERYTDWVQRKMRKTVWVTGGCRSWYLDAQGRNTTLWPGFTWDFARRLRRFDPENYVLR